MNQTDLAVFYGRNQIPLGTRAEMKVLYRFIGTCLRWHSPIVAISTSVNTTKRKSPPKPGEQLIDYLDKVLTENPDGLSVPSLIYKMKSIGWQTDSSKPERMIAVYMYQNKEKYRRDQNKKWKITQDSITR